MRGSYEESPEKKALCELHEAARRFAGFYLVHGFGGPDIDAADARLAKAAVDYAATQPRPKKKRTAP